jgi:hypothetical protein
LVTKWDSIDKHASKRKALDGKWFVDWKCGHPKNEIVYVQLSTTIVFQQFSLGQAMEDKQKLVQFATIFNLLSKGKSMTNYEDFQHLFKFFKLWSIPKKHWFDGVG